MGGHLLKGCLTTIRRVTSPSVLFSSCSAKSVEGAGANFFATFIGCLSSRELFWMISDETHCGNCFCKALTWCLGAPERGWVGNGHLSDSYLVPFYRSTYMNLYMNLSDSYLSIDQPIRTYMNIYEPIGQLPFYRSTWEGDDVDSPRGGGRLQHWTPEQGGGLSIHMTISFFRSHKGYMVKKIICTYICTWT